MPVLRERGVMRNLLIEAETGEPAPGQMHAQLFHQLAFTGDAVQIANQQYAQQEFGVNRGPPRLAVAVFQLLLSFKSHERLHHRGLKSWVQLAWLSDSTEPQLRSTFRPCCPVYRISSLVARRFCRSRYRHMNVSPFGSPQTPVNSAVVEDKSVVRPGLGRPIPWSRTRCRAKSKCFIWRRLGARKPLFLSLQLYRSCTERLRQPNQLDFKFSEPWKVEVICPDG